jgi:hypothetical protein
MKRCVIISNYANNAYRKSLLKDKIELFNSQNIDVILASSDHMETYDGVKNYITTSHVCDKQYLTENIFSLFAIDKTVFFTNFSNRKIWHSNYFIKLYQTTLNYAKNLGYDFCYFIEFDSVINKNHYSFIFNEVDYTKVYFYSLGHPCLYQTIFFYGNLNVLCSFFTEDKLSEIEDFAKKRKDRFK